MTAKQSKDITLLPNSPDFQVKPMKCVGMKNVWPNILEASSLHNNYWTTVFQCCICGETTKIHNETFMQFFLNHLEPYYILNVLYSVYENFEVRWSDAQTGKELLF